MDIDALVSSVQLNLTAIPYDMRGVGEETSLSRVAVVPWNWVAITLVGLFERYPSGLTFPVILSELQQSWDAIFGTTWSLPLKKVVATQICEILDHGRVDPSVVLQCEIRSVVKLEESKETWVAQLVDAESSDLEARTLNWLLHQKYLPLMLNSGDTLKRTSSRGLIHTYNRAKAIRSYNGPFLFQKGRILRIGSPRLRQQWNHPSGQLSLLPSEDTIILLHNYQEASAWMDYNPDILKTKDKSANARFSFKAYVLLVPPWNNEDAQVSPYIQSPTMIYGQEARTVDIILGNQESRPLAVLRLSSSHTALLSSILEGDILCLHNCFLLFESRDFVSTRIKKNHPSLSHSSHEPVRLQLPIFSYESGTLAILLQKRLLDTSVMIDTSTLSESTFETVPQTNDYRFHPFKVSPVLLQPNCNRVMMVGYATNVFQRQEPKNGFRRHGIRLQDTQSAAACDITVWESSNSPSSITHSIRSGHLILIQGIWTVSSKDGASVMANITDDSSKIINISKLEGLVTSYSDFKAICDPQVMNLVPGQNWESMLPTARYGPFILQKCRIQTSTMTLPVSLSHNMCGRNVGQPPKQTSHTTNSTPSTDPLICKFCNHKILDWKTECEWAFDVDWNLEIDDLGETPKTTSLAIRAASEVTARLLGISARDFVQLTPREQDLIAMHPVTWPISGKACLSRSIRQVWHLDQFVTYA